jgi:hypothetical protein
MIYSETKFTLQEEAFFSIFRYKNQFAGEKAHMYDWQETAVSEICVLLYNFHVQNYLKHSAVLLFLKAVKRTGAY